MSIIKFTVEDSKVSEILKALLNSSVAVKDVEIINTQHSEAAMVSKSDAIEDSESNSAIYQHNQLIDQNEVIGTADVTSSVKLVGGTIFYIDNTSNGEYQFFDSDGNLIENVQVGDKPYAYRVIKKGSGDKYYVYHDEVYSNLTWTYCKEDNYVYESLGTSGDRGSGKINTEIVMAKDYGAYISKDSKEYPTIWYKLQQVRNAEVGGCDDWFVPSAYEIDELRVAIKSGNITGGKIAGSSYKESIFSKKWLWSSSDYSAKYSWYWGFNNQSWCYSYKNYNNSVFFVRAF